MLFIKKNSNKLKTKKKKKIKPSKIGQNNPSVFFGDDARKNLWTISLHKFLAAIPMVIYGIPKRPFQITAAYSFASLE